MAYVTRAMRDRAADNEYAKLACDCGHLKMNHHERWTKPSILDGEIVMAERISPIGTFPCDAVDCDCQDVSR